MTEREKNMRKVSGILADTTELRKLILENPTLPIVILCGKNSKSGEYGWIYASDIRFDLGEILDCDQPINEEIVYSDRDMFNEQLDEWLWDKELGAIGEEAFQKMLAEEKAKYEPHWKKCILIYADN